MVRAASANITDQNLIRSGVLHAGFYLSRSYRRVFRGEHSLRLCLRKTLKESDRTMTENIIVGIVSIGLLIYMFWTLIRPEHF
jgi:K+-transporting ATPase KdpF subunit